MFFHYKTQGLFLKKEDRGDADQLFTIYTKDFGKLEILAKAIRKISSKLRAGAEIFYLSDIEFIQAKRNKTLTDAVPIEKFKNLKKDLNRLKAAYQISEVSDSLIRGQEPDEKIWELFIDVFKKLNNLHFLSENLQLIYYYFLWNFLSLLGYQLEIYNCAVCGKKMIPEKIYFNPRGGGTICKNCAKAVKNAKELRSETVKIIRIIIKKDWKLLSKIKIEPSHLKSLELISKSYLNYVSSMVK